MIFVDTGYLFAITTPGDQLHGRATSWAKSLREPVLTTEYVLWELVNGLSRPLDRRQAHALLDNIQMSSAWEVVEARRDLISPGWSLTDCISFIVMRDRGITRALTHDHHFEQAGFEALLRRDPS
jgi:predicted nucleic acid-binding protein